MVLRLGPEELDLDGLLERESLSERSESDLSLDESSRLACLTGLRGPEELDLDGLSERESSESDLSELFEGLRAAGRLAGLESSDLDLSESDLERDEPEGERERDPEFERDPDLERERELRLPSLSVSLSLLDLDLDFLLLRSSSLLVEASRSRCGGNTESGLAFAASMASRFFCFCRRTTKIGMRITAATPIAAPTTMTAIIPELAVAETIH